MKNDIPCMSLFDLIKKKEVVPEVSAVEVVRPRDRVVTLSSPSSKRGMQLSMVIHDRLLEYLRDNIEMFICDINSLESAPHIRAKLFLEVLKAFMPKDMANMPGYENTSRAILQKIFKKMS